MKSKQIYSAFFLACILGLFSCTEMTFEEGLLKPTTDTELEVSTFNDEGMIVETTSFTAPKGTPSSSIESRGNKNQIATGDFQTISGNEYLFSAIENKGGVHGEWEIKAIWGSYKLETICVSTNEEDGTAMVAGIVTEVFAPGILELDYIVFFRVKDNGEGANSAPDQGSRLFVFFRNYRQNYGTLENFLANINCANPSYVANILGPYEDRIGQIQVK